MKNFKDNLEEESTAGKKYPYDNPRPEGHQTLKQRLLRGLSRYSMLIIVGLAALSITFLHFKGKFLLKVLQHTPLPTFFLEKIIAPKPVPDKTDVYEEALKEAEKKLRQQRSLSSKLRKPNWQYSPLSGGTKSISQSQIQDSSITNSKLLAYIDTVNINTVDLDKPSIVEKRKKVKKKVRSINSIASNQTIAEKKQEDINFFQPVKVASKSSENDFIPCSVHGGQEVSNNQMLTLRLTKDLMVGGQKIPAGTLIYGTVRLAQNRIQVSISRILHYAVIYRVHDHTYHEGVLLDENQNVWKDATRETAYRQGQRSARELPIDAAAELGRSILQHSKRKQATVFLPDGYPLYLVNQQPSTP